MKKVILVIFLTLISIQVYAEELKVAVSSNGKIELNGKEVSMVQLQESFKKPGIQVLYYRANPESEPHPNAMKIIEIIVKNELPVSLSATPDFSTYVDGNGNVHKRKK